MSYHHLNRFDRARIEALHTLGFSTRQIAIQTGRHHSSIARELVRNTTENTYLAEDAHQSYENRRNDSKPHGKYD
jgi:IS30 family transposase